MDSNKRNTFPKAERLCSRKIIEALFAGGRKSMSVYPLRAVYMPLEDGDMPFVDMDDVPAVQMMVSVSKRRFKHAVDRNRMKRLVREAYRTHKHALVDCLESRHGHMALAFLWLSNGILPYDTVERKVVLLLQKIVEAQEAAKKETHDEAVVE